jgi:hypothetical protein
VVVQGGDDSIEKKDKAAIKMGGELKDRYDWIMIVDADTIVTASKEHIERLCNAKPKDLFFFCGALLQTYRRRMCHGIRFYRTMMCEKVYDLIRKVSFDSIPIRSSKLITMFIRDNGIPIEYTRVKKALGIHLWFVNNNVNG